jgi:ABC-type glycerol-3-phosphate transport system permease component
MRNQLGSGFAYTIVAVLVIGTLVPFVSIILAALHPSGSVVPGFGWPDHPTLANFAEAWNGAGMSGLLLNSAILAVLVVPLTVSLATLAGFALANLKLPCSRGVLTFFVAGLTIPMELVIVPLYFTLDSIGLANNLVGVALAEVALFLPFSVFWMHAHFSSIPDGLIDAAQIDGATPSTTLRLVLLPLSGPALTTLAVLVFMWCWKQFMLVLILIQDPLLRTAPAGLGFFVGEYMINIPVLSAAALIVILPIAILYVLLQRYFVAGLMQGSLKG